ncbi:MAG: tyrosine-protein phosphatase, partial [Pseudomonadota bacterium]
PLAFNCSAGKDRAGTAAALLLSALGVPRETVVYDYALSDDYVDYMAEFMGDEARAKAAAEGDESPYAFLMKLPPEMVAPLMESNPIYIETTLDAMEAEHGSVLAYIQAEYDVTDEELASIRAALLR